MKKVCVDEVRHVAMLARLTLTPKEEHLYTEQFNDILKYIHVIEGLDLEHVEPTTHVQQLVNVLRKDAAVKSEESFVQSVLAEAPKRKDTLFQVPPVIE